MPPRLYSKGRVLGHKRAKRNTRPNTSLLQIEGVATKEDAQFYLGKVCSYKIYDNILCQSIHVACCFCVQSQAGDSGLQGASNLGVRRVFALLYTPLIFHFRLLFSVVSPDHTAALVSSNQNSDPTFLPVRLVLASGWCVKCLRLLSSTSANDWFLPDALPLEHLITGYNDYYFVHHSAFHGQLSYPPTLHPYSYHAI